jgi:hypothetical protein
MTSIDLPDITELGNFDDFCEHAADELSDMVDAFDAINDIIFMTGIDLDMTANVDDGCQIASIEAAIKMPDFLKNDMIKEIIRLYLEFIYEPKKRIIKKQIEQATDYDIIKKVERDVRISIEPIDKPKITVVEIFTPKPNLWALRVQESLMRAYKDTYRFLLNSENKDVVWDLMVNEMNSINIAILSKDLIEKHRHLISLTWSEAMVILFEYQDIKETHLGYDTQMTWDKTSRDDYEKFAEGISQEKYNISHLMFDVFKDDVSLEEFPEFLSLRCKIAWLRKHILFVNDMWLTEVGVRFKKMC